MRKNRWKNYLFSIVLFAAALIYTYFNPTLPQQPKNNVDNIEITENIELDRNNLPEYIGKNYITINNNVANFSQEELKTESFEKYSELDELGRCGVADAIIGVDLMPNSKRENISGIRPSGWKSIRDDSIDGGSLYNRSHLIAFQLAGENANERNLITGTRYFNAKGMLPFEIMVNNYVRETKNHVRYRITPIFVGDELVARGVQMEAFSVEDGGKAINFNVYCFNVQPGYEINYKTGHAKKIK